MPSDRPRLSGPIDEDVLDRWRAFVGRHDLDLGPLLEAIGRQLDPDMPARRLPAWQRQAIADARAIRTARKARRPRGD